MRKTLFVAMASAGLLTACGGGSGSDANTQVTPTPPSTTATVALSGTAAKGLMANADVGVYAVNADGSVATTALQTTTTDGQGRYSLSFTGTKDQPYVVRVSAKADGTTTHADEVTGIDQPLPVGFQMRSLVVPTATGAVATSASITPFSEMAVAAAAKASGGVTAVNAAQAISTVTQLLGFNPTTVAATTTATAASGDEQKLAVMLTAVSQMASNGDLGCGTGGLDVKTQCVVDALGAAASTTSIKLSSGSGNTATDVSAVLSGAVSTVLANPSLAGAVSSSALATVVANLACTTNCTAATAGTTPTVDKTATAIAAAKLLFAEMKSDWSAMFSRGSSIASGAANLQANAFEGAMRDVHLPVNTLLTNSGALLMGIDLYNDYKAGRTSVPSRGRGLDQVDNDGSANFSGYNAAGCTLYQDATTLTTATAPDNANFIGCSARYYLTRTLTATGFTTNEYRHGFTVTPNADGSFGWQTRARLRVTAPNGTVLSNAALQTDASGTPLDPFTGTVTPTISNGSVTAFTMVGNWAGGFVDSGTTLANHQHAVSLSGTRSFEASTATLEETASVSGSLMAKDSAGATLSTLTVKSANLLNSAPASRDSNGNLVASAGGDLTGGALNLVFSTATAEFEGVFELGASAWDKSGTVLLPTTAKLIGALRNIAGGTTTEFLKGEFTASTSGYAAFDATQAFSATNRYSMDMRFVGSITAPGRPVLEISFGGTQLMDSDDGSTQGVTLQYRTLVAGQPRLVVSVTGSRDATTGEVNRFKLTEASAGLSLNWVDGASAVELVQGDSLVIGSVNMNSGLVTFSDNSFVSLDVGL